MVRLWAFSLVLTIVVTVFPCTGRAQSPTAEAPTFQVGDEWQYVGRAPTTLRVLAVEGDVIVTEMIPNPRCAGCRQRRDKNFTVVTLIDKEGNAAQDPSIGLQLLNFPLTVGKKWESNQDLYSASAGRTFPYENRFRVEKYEDVKTKAGTFKAFRISWVQENKGSYRWNGRATLWYSPDVKRFVKAEAHTPDWFQDWELASFTLK